MAVSDITVLIIAAFALGLVLRMEDKFIGNLCIFGASLGTLLVLTGNEAIVAVLLIVLTLGNLIYGVFTASK